MATKDNKREERERVRVSNPRGGKREGAGSGGAREGAGRKKRHSTYKTRNWATILYPESAKEGWRGILRGWCCQALLSPLHDKDVNPDGKPKKPHYHLMCMWDGPKGQALMEERFAELGGVGCQPCNSSRGYARYLCHLDNPEKYQYPVEAVEAFGGANYLDVIALESDRRATIAEMCDWCDETGCFSYAELAREARRNHPMWWQALTSSATMIMFRYIRSIEDEFKRGGIKSRVEQEARDAEVEAKRIRKQEEERKELEKLGVTWFGKPNLSPVEVAAAKLKQAQFDLETARARLMEEVERAERATETGAGPLCAGKDT